MFGLADHYFTSNPSAAHDEKEVKFELRGHALRFKTDSGVFSKERVDYGSVLLIEEMDILETDHVLDIGCGYGPIGLTAAKLAQKGHVLMLDVNERAVALARSNAKLNHIENVDVKVSDLFESVDKDQSFDVILTNPPIRAGKQTVHQIFEDAYPFLKEGGSLWVVIQKKQGAPSALSKLQEIYRDVEKVSQDKGYWILRAQK